MVSSFQERAKQGIAGAFFMLLVVGGVAPSSARASCGHDVTSDLIRSAQESLYGLDILKYSADPAPAGHRRDLPCSGPGCSEGRNWPPAPATSISVRISDPFCCKTFAIRGEGRDSAENLDDPSIAHPRHIPSPLERPPRDPRRRTLS
jgi:hypothetical protein